MRYPEELKIIQDARAAEPKKPAKTLATELWGRTGITGRTFYSIYSVIRRFDANQKQKGKGKKALAAV